MFVSLIRLLSVEFCHFGKSIYWYKTKYVCVRVCAQYAPNSNDYGIQTSLSLPPPLSIYIYIYIT